jgi:hypothetical protein
MGRLDARSSGMMHTPGKCGVNVIGVLFSWGKAMTINKAAAIVRILAEYKNIAVVGLSSNPMGASDGVSQYMHQNGYRIIPVSPTETEVLGKKSYASETIALDAKAVGTGSCA